MADAEVKESAGRLPLSNDWFARDDRIRLTSAPMKEKLTAEFETAPGTEELIITVFGRIAAAFADGCEISFAFEGRNSYGAGSISPCFAVRRTRQQNFDRAESGERI